MVDRPPFVSPTATGAGTREVAQTGNYLPDTANWQTPFVMVAEDSSRSPLTFMSRSPNATGAGQLPMFLGARYNTHERDLTKHAQWQEDVAESLRRANIPSSTLSTSSPIPLSSMPPLVRWHMRSGRTAQYHEWEFGLKRVCMHVGVPYSSLPLPMPTLQSVSQSVTQHIARTPA